MNTNTNPSSLPQQSLSKKDLFLGVIAGAMMGLLFLPVLKAAKPDLFASLSWFVLPFFVVATPAGLVIANFLGRSVPLVWQLAKFVVTGGLNTLVDLGVLSFFLWISQDVLVAQPTQVIADLGILVITYYTFYKAISFIVANINSYVWNKYWTFQQGGSKKHTEFIQFLLVSLIGFFINVFVASFVFKSISPTTSAKVDGRYLR